MNKYIVSKWLMFSLESNLLWVFLLKNTIWKLSFIFTTKRRIVFKTNLFLKIYKYWLKFHPVFLLVRVNFLGLKLIIYLTDALLYLLAQYFLWVCPDLTWIHNFHHLNCFFFVKVTTVNIYKVTLLYLFPGTVTLLVY